ncbi:MAG: M23 family metallopeptidase [Bacteroidales bacterium]|jgi:murein DD-endopeptidase MepM/ murein hydrolase activator NlpD|nr:M23 family metallopeptidase [Bacteroidales bacterium]
MKYRLLLIFTAFLAVALNSAAQKQNNINTDTRSAARRFADSLYEVHTLSKIRKIDTIKATKPEIIPPKYITDSSSYPSSTLYQNTWFCDKVKIPNFQFTQIPDQIIIRLTGRNKKGKYSFPCKTGVKSSNYGWRWGRPHTGVDIALNVGEPIYATFDGVVRVAKVNGGYGKMILIRHYNNLETLYGHLSEIKVKPGQIVKAGDVIGLSGNTGTSTGPHLHFECRLLYACFDPELVFDIEKKCLRADFLRIDKTFFGVKPSRERDNEAGIRNNLTKVHRTFKDKPDLSINTLSDNKK